MIYTLIPTEIHSHGMVMLFILIPYNDLHQSSKSRNRFSNGTVTLNHVIQCQVSSDKLTLRSPGQGHIRNVNEGIKPKSILTETFGKCNEITVILERLGGQR